MSTSPNEHEIQVPEHGSETEKPIETLDSVQLELLDVLTRLFTEPDNQDKQQAVLTAASKLVEKFSISVDQINTGFSDNDDRIDYIHKLVMKEDRNRQESFAVLAPCIDHKNRALKADKVRDMIEVYFSDSGSYQELNDKLSEPFALGLQEDIRHLMSHLLQDHTEYNEHSRVRIKREIGSHASGCREHRLERIPYCHYENVGYIESDE